MILKYNKTTFHSMILLCLLFFQNCTALAASWSTGGPYGGSINSLAMSQTNPDIIYAATVNNLFKTYNGGESWTSLDAVSLDTDGSKVLFVSVAPSNPDVVLICIRSASDSKDYLYKSTDGGITLGQIVGYSDEGEVIDSIAIHPQNPDIFYVGVGYDIKDLDILSPVIFKTTDGGVNYTAQLFGELKSAHSILIDTDDPEHIYVGGYDEGGSNRDNFYMSEDGGDHWDSNLPDGSIVALAMTPAGYDSPVLYALTQGATSGIYKSLDRGEHWVNILFFDDVPMSYGIGALAVDPLDPNIIYAGRIDYGIYMTKNGGQDWFKIDKVFLTSSWLSAMVIDPRNGMAFMGFADFGVFKSTDRGDTWRASDQGIGKTYVEDLAILPDSSNAAFAVIRGAAYKLAKTTDSGKSWEYLPNSPTLLGAVAIDPQTSSVIWVGDGLQWTFSSYVYKSDDGGQSYNEGKKFFSFESASNYTGVSSILINPEDSDAILVASKESLWNGGLYGGGVLARSLDGGNTWDELIILPTICIAMDPHNHQVVYAGRRRDGQVFKFTNVWGEYVRIEITPTGGIGDVHAIEVALNSIVYVAASDGLRRWNGNDWTTLAGLPTSNITALAIDRTANPETVYAGTAADGVFASKDGGNTWLPLNEGLGSLFIVKLAISSTFPKMLYAGTAYGGVWSLALDESPNVIPPPSTGTPCLSWLMLLLGD